MILQTCRRVPLAEFTGKTAKKSDSTQDVISLKLALLHETVFFASGQKRGADLAAILLAGDWANLEAVKGAEVADILFADQRLEAAQKRWMAGPEFLEASKSSRLVFVGCELDHIATLRRYGLGRGRHGGLLSGLERGALLTGARRRAAQAQIIFAANAGT